MTNELIFGLTFEQIQAAQQRKSFRQAVVPQPDPVATDADRAMLAQYGSIDALKAAGMFGVVDRLSRI